MKSKTEEMVVDCETTNKNPHRADLLGVAAYINGQPSYRRGKPDLDLENKYIITHNGKYDAVVLRRAGYPKFEINFDTIVAHYLLDISSPRKLETLAKEHLKWEKVDLMDLFNRFNPKKNGEPGDRTNLPERWWEDAYNDKGKLAHHGIPFEVLARYAEEDAKATYLLYEIFKEQLKKYPEIEKWFYEVEMQVLNVLIETELKGVAADLNEAVALQAEFEKKKQEALDMLYFLAGEPGMNFNSPKQLQEVLFKKLRLKPLYRTKAGWSTDADTLEELAENGSAFCQKLLEYRSYEKLLGTYIEPIVEQVSKTGRVHTVFNQTLTRTRRFSSKEPNLQNIPTRSDLGKLVRKCFKASDGYMLLDIDYSQIEPRLLAHFSDEPVLINAYRNKEDIYLRAVEIVKQRGYELSRDRAKILVLSLIYGKTPWGLAQDWGCSEDEAQEIIDALMGGMPYVKQYIESQQDEAMRNNGWLKTLAGLPVYVGDVHSNSEKIRAKCLRRAVNYPIQGSSQDILKKAMVDVYQKYDLFPVLMVHDELIYELHESLIGEKQKMGGVSPCYSKLIVKQMESAWKLKVPLVVEAKISERWEK
jgi:DNA polymerase I